jgi:hypothetical protein
LFRQCPKKIQNAPKRDIADKEGIQRWSSGNVEFSFSSGFIGNFDEKPSSGFNLDFWHHRCYTCVVAVATGNQVNKAVIIITRLSRCSRRT